MYRMVTVKIEHGPQLECFCPMEVVVHLHSFCVLTTTECQEFGRVGKIENREADLPSNAQPRVVRQATLQDQSRANETALMGKMAVRTLRATVERMNLQIKLVTCRYTFDRALLLVQFTAEEKVEVRDISKVLAGELHVRVDMKQIGVRDQAGIAGGLGTCGRNLCCCSWLEHFASINVRMAKTQGLSLNPAAIGGCCGRLKCCLGYEFDVYKDLGKRMPGPNAPVQCPDGNGYVIDRNILQQKVKVRLEDDRIIEYPADAVREVWNKRQPRRVAEPPPEPALDEGTDKLPDES